MNVPVWVLEGTSDLMSLGCINTKNEIAASYGCLCLEKERKVAQSCPTLCNPMDCSPPGSSVHGIFQAIILE